MGKETSEPPSGRWLKGFARSVSGETIGYHSGHPSATEALLVRALDGRMAIEWETEAVPEDMAGKSATFIWLAGKAASMGSHSFELSVDGAVLFAIRTGREGAAADARQTWTAPGGARLEYRRAYTDQFGDTFGPMILTLPASSVAPGRPVRLGVRGENAGSRDWFMTFQFALEEAVRIRTEPVLVRESGAVRQLVRVEADHPGPGAAVAIRASDGSALSGRLEPGYNSFLLPVQPVEAESKLVVEVLVDGRPAAQKTLALRPVRPRLLYLLPHSHTDIGYSDLQVKVEKDHWRFLLEAADLACRTEGYPEGARFKWNVEVLWPLETFLRQAGAEERAAVIEAARRGRVEFQATLANVLTGVCPPEELVRLTDCARRLRREFGLAIDSAMITDIPGSLWTVVPALALAGVKYYSSGPNYMPFLPDGGDRIGHFSKAWADKPFYWLSPSGREKVLFWTAGRGYSWFHGLNMGELTMAGERQILEYARELEDASYPYDIVQVRYTIGGDNGPPDPRLPDRVREWNERYESPRLVIATASEMFREFERRHGAEIPSFSGDLSPYWEDGYMSTTAESVMNRRAVARLLQAEAVWAMRNPAAFPADEFDEAWRQALLWDEHTWGAHNSVSEPDHPDVRAQWEYKRAFALEADKRSRELLDRALGRGSGPSLKRAAAATEDTDGTSGIAAAGNATADLTTPTERLTAPESDDDRGTYPAACAGDPVVGEFMPFENKGGSDQQSFDRERREGETRSGFPLQVDLRPAQECGRNGRDRSPAAFDQDSIVAIDIINTSSWSRTDVVMLPQGLSAAGDSVTDGAGRHVPSQRLSDGRLAVLAEDVPGLGAKRLFVGPTRSGSEETGRGAPGVEPESARAVGFILENGLLKLSIDPETGAVSSLAWKERGLELVDPSCGAGLNDYLYVPGRDPKTARRASNVRVEVKERGPLVASLLVTSDAPGCRSMRREIILYRGLDRVDIVNTLEKIEVREKEAGHIAFPFRVPGGAMRMDIGWGFVRPEDDQLPGSCRDFLCVHNGVDVSNGDFGVTWASSDAPLVEPGAMTDETLNEKNTRSWRNKTAPGGVFYSYIFNNYWHTNYKAGQEGEIVLRYSFRPHSGPFDSAETKKFSINAKQPLLAAPADPSAPPPPPLLKIAPSSIIVSSIKPSRDGRSLILRLFNASDEPQEAWFHRPGRKPPRVFLSNLVEEDGQEIKEAVVIPPWGIMTLKIEVAD
ncbi:MAG: hypothetical protein FJY83_00940 [Candidatus Aminicenantes bacterium]|nr:hypothetical protein [Candidatus Aminicenantes bacterium]